MPRCARNDKRFYAPTPLIGLLREGRTPPDRRVALTPKKCVELQDAYPGLRVRAQPSPHRAFSRPGIPRPRH
ncbi:MAG: hypothetical protein WKG07_09130 [Hymenobacter sp.]